MNSQHDESDEELARKAQDGCLQSMEALVIRHQNRLFRFLLVKTQNRSNAEDLMQETFVKAYRKINRFNPKYAFSTWLFTIANRLAVSAWRKYKPTVDEIPEITDSAPCPATQTERDDNRENLWELARIALNDTQYTALWLHYGEDLSIVEIAQTLRRTQTGVKVLLHRARKKLSKSLTPTTRANQNSDLTFQPNAT